MDWVISSIGPHICHKGQAFAHLTIWEKSTFAKIFNSQGKPIAEAWFSVANLADATAAAKNWSEDQLHRHC